MLPASLMTRWNSLFLHTLRHGQGWVGGVGMMTFLSLAHMWHATHLTFLALAHMWHATQVMGRVGCVGWGWWRFYHLHTCGMLRTWRFLHFHTCDMLRKWWAGLGGWGGDDDVRDTGFFDRLRRGCTVHADGNKAWKSESKRRSVKFASVSQNKMQFTKWHSKTRLTGTQALDKVWSHLKKHFPKSLYSRSKSDRRFDPRMEQYVCSYMWRFNNRNWWKQLGQLCQKHWQKESTSANEVFFFGASYFQSKIAKIELRTQCWRVFYTSVQIQNRKKRGN